MLPLGLTLDTPELLGAVATISGGAVAALRMLWLWFTAHVEKLHEETKTARKDYLEETKSARKEFLDGMHTIEQACLERADRTERKVDEIRTVLRERANSDEGNETDDGLAAGRRGA